MGGSCKKRKFGYLRWTPEEGSGVCASLVFRYPNAVSISRFCFSVWDLTTEAAPVSHETFIIDAITLPSCRFELEWLSFFFPWNFIENRRYFEECWKPIVLVTINFHCMDKKTLIRFSKYVLQKQYKFGTTWVNYVIIFIFGWTIICMNDCKMTLLSFTYLWYT